MTNPYKKVAPAFGVRGALFSLLGLTLLARAVPTLITMQGMPDIPAAVIGAFLLTIGVIDLIRAVQQMTPVREDKLGPHAIDYLYGRHQELPATLMDSDGNPNEDAQGNLMKWLARVFPRLSHIPWPYARAMHAAVIALALGVMGLAILMLLRVLLAASTSAPQLANILDWYLWLYFVAGFAFWAALSRFGFRRALRFEGNLNGGKMVVIFLVLLAGAVFLAIGMAADGTALVAPPSLGGLSTLLVASSVILILAAVAITVLRARRAPDGYTVFRGEEFFTVGMHPTDLVNVIKSYTGRIAGGVFRHMGKDAGKWKPKFAEHTAVSAGEFEAKLDAESAIRLNENVPARLERVLGTGLVWLGVLMTAAAGFFLFQAASVDWAASGAIAEAMRAPVGFFIFGVVFYRLGIIPVAELEWSSVITSCNVSGTFQTQGGMALMQAGDNSIKGSVLTSATVQPRCAYLTSVGFLQPSLAKQEVARVIDQVQPADQVSNELLSAIYNQARQMQTIGTPEQPMQLKIPDQTSTTPEETAEPGGDTSTPEGVAGDSAEPPADDQPATER